MAAILTAYLFCGKGIAHVSLHGIYIGEMAIGLCLIVFLFFPRMTVIRYSPVSWMIILFAVICFIRTVPYISDYGVDALRDAVIYGYSICALLVSARLVEGDNLRRAAEFYHRIVSVFVICAPLLLYLGQNMPLLNGEDFSLIVLKPGDVAVQLAGIGAFRLLGLHRIVERRGRFGRLGHGLFWLLWTIDLGWAVSLSRGGMLAVGTAIGIVLAFGFARARVFAALGVLTVLLVGLAAIDFKVETAQREVSVRQIVSNAVSIFPGQDLSLDSDVRASADTLSANTQWRLFWWRAIISDTLTGENFWGGKGFGYNLAEDVGYDGVAGLRSPHSIHLAILARAGVPGLLAWLVSQGAFAWALVRMARTMAGRGQAGWARLHIWVLAFWAAFMVNASFDVYIEGPQGGIWFWCVVGYGLSAMAVGRRFLALSEAASELRGARPISL